MRSVYVAKYSPDNLKGFHGADGRVDNHAFDVLFAQADEDSRLALTDDQLRDFTFDHRDPRNLLTKTATWVECIFIVIVMQRVHGRILKSDLQDFYHGWYIRCLVNQRGLGEFLPAFLRDPSPPPTRPPPPPP